MPMSSPPGRASWSHGRRQQDRFLICRLHRNVLQNVFTKPFEVYEVAITNGSRLRHELASFGDQPPLPASLALRGYQTISGSLRSNAQNAVRSMIASCGISFTNATYVEVCSAGVEKEFDAAYTNWFDPSHGVIMLWSSELLWQSWKNMALEAGRMASHLVAVVRLTIVNEASQITIRQASKHSSSSRSKGDNQVDYTSLDNGYYAILGTPNGANTMRMFHDHRTELGHRIVEKIVVFGKKGPEMDKPEVRSMVIILSDSRSPPSRGSRWVDVSTIVYQEIPGGDLVLWRKFQGFGTFHYQKRKLNEVQQTDSFSTGLRNRMEEVVKFVVLVTNIGV
ncbi:predicted protein [Pyrenophora tritici-repentis Pt-1C-BFP]|uniref:Uncharacterized protein n=1 Tax=Pyrenophora tritici-repentis (strain Pt-1C-BFP) TaxID=426418 RepID=B2W843_PYRTR|nr:uncharacterized protein PTRG_05981 [Pyrenophora tritici-repentis Pt-1C-BFP]EDU48901.1 predicted protein [Pyrenophora tritici-repentis Pt-1C-BFP]